MKYNMLAFEQVKHAWLVGTANGMLKVSPQHDTTSAYLMYMKYWLFWWQL